jgi:pimeloyl-ACP methyl ester carboxylesterase
MRLLAALLLVSLTSLRAAEPPRPILLVPGLWYEYAPKVYGMKVYDRYVKWLVEEGFPRERIHVLDYTSHHSLKRVSAQMSAQLRKIRAQYPPDTRFDVMGHSLGGFVALYSILTTGFSTQVKKFISLAGIPQGWDGFGACKIGLCGEMHKQLIPYRSTLIRLLFEKFHDEIARLDKCSIFSPQDGLVRPYDAGRFEDGIAVELPDTPHMDILFKRATFDALKRECYHGSFLP